MDTATRSSWRRSEVSIRAVLGGLIVMALIWATWPVLNKLAERWSEDPRYAHGYLIPAFAAALLWIRRDRWPSRWSPSWLGLPILMIGIAMQTAGTFYFYEWFEAAGLLPQIAGLALLLGGREALRWAGPSIAFLVFMVPLPYQIEGALSYPLQRVGTKVSTYLMQTLGLPAIAEGNIIQLDDVSIGVVEACSGLGMIFTFAAMSAGVALLIRRPLLDKVAIFLSAVPIAVAVNVLRITVTGILHRLVSHELADRVFHDLAGWLMMPAALALMAAELWVLSQLLVEVAPLAEQLSQIGLRSRGRKRDGRPLPPIGLPRPTKAS